MAARPCTTVGQWGEVPVSGRLENPTAKWRRWVQRGLGLLIGLVVALIVGEVVVRAFDLPPRPLPPLAAGYYELSPNRLLKYRFRPGMTPEDVADPGDHRGFRINSAGFRDVEHLLSKPHGCYRIVVLGDSITAGVGIEDLDAVFTRRLEGLLNADGQAVSFEVINLGVGGYHTLQEAETLLVSGLRYQPDHVVVAFCVNDISWDADGQVLEELRGQLPPGQQSVLLTGWRSSSWTSGLLSQSRLCFFAYHRASSLEPFLELEWRRESRSGYVGTPVRQGLQRLESMAEAGGFQCHLFLVPAFDRHFQAYAHTELHSRVLEQASTCRSVTVVDLLDGFDAQEVEAVDLSHDGLHPNAKGHEILASLVHRHLKPVVSDGGRGDESQ